MTGTDRTRVLPLPSRARTRRAAVQRHAPCPVRLLPGREECPPTVGGPVAVAARMLFCRGEPDAGERLIHEHRPDGHGRCRGCPHTNTLAPRHPCVLRLIGEATVRLHEQRRRPDPTDAA